MVKDASNDVPGEVNVKGYIIPDAQEAFVLYIQSPEALEDLMRLRESRKKSTRSMILPIGCEITLINGDSVCFGNIDVCSKIFPKRIQHFGLS